MCREPIASTQIVGVIPTATSLVPTIQVTNVVTNDASRLNLVSLSINQGAPSLSAIGCPSTDAEYPTIAIGSPPTRTKPKPCQLIVAACLAEFRKTTSRCPLPIPPFVRHGTPSSRPPRHSGHWGNSSSNVLKLVPTVLRESPSKGAPMRGKFTKELKMNLDAIFSKLIPHEQAKYLRAKTKVKIFAFKSSYLDCLSLVKVMYS